MLIELTNDLVVECAKCGLYHKIDKDSLEIYTTTYERNMGEEIEYNFIGEYECDRCGNCMKYTVRAYEYPIGALNYDDYDSQGCSFVQEPTVEVNYYDFDYQFYDEEKIGTEVNRVYANIDRIINNNEEIYNLTPREFEEVVAELFEQQGFNVELTPTTRDGGYDIIATKDIGGLPFMLLIECKKYSSKNKIGVNIVRSLLGVQSDKKANKAVLVTTSKFSKEAIKFAERQQHLISLLDFNDLMRMIEQ